MERGQIPLHLYIYSIKETLKVFFSETSGQNCKQYGRNIHYVTFYKNSFNDASKNIAARGRGLL